MDKADVLSSACVILSMAVSGVSSCWLGDGAFGGVAQQREGDAAAEDDVGGQYKYVIADSKLSEIEKEHKQYITDLKDKVCVVIV